MEIHKYTELQQNLLIASIIGDGEITKCYKGSRRKNNSYREHFCIEQEDYRKWKQSLFPDVFYLTPKSHTLRSGSSKLFTELYPLFYNGIGEKMIPVKLLPLCKHLIFLAVLYMDDGTVSITRTFNHNTKTVFYAPHIILYLQNYRVNQLQILQKHIEDTYGIRFSMNKRKDGYGYILKLTRTGLTYKFLKIIEPITSSCPSMYYKTNWDHRFRVEKDKLRKSHNGYKAIASSSERRPDYTVAEIKQIITLKNKGTTDQSIAIQLNHTYWSVVYKVRDLRKRGRL